MDQTGVRADDLSQETLSEGSGIALSPEGFFQLKIGMRVRHAKFGEGKVTSVEGVDEDQKATIFFRNVGPKRLKVRYANLEILQ
jgi:DNA helicase-2/ATP-dependent DNA helicase PcrA